MKKVPFFRHVLIEFFSECVILFENVFPQTCRGIKYGSTVDELFFNFNAIFEKSRFLKNAIFSVFSPSSIYTLNTFDLLQN